MLHFAQHDISRIWQATLLKPWQNWKLVLTADIIEREMFVQDIGEHPPERSKKKAMQ